MSSPYHLVATVGLDPASLTRVAWALARAGHTPAAVHVLTTGQGADRILIQVPGVGSAAELKEIIGTTAQLTFQPVVGRSQNENESPGAAFSA